jgi:hypothetical protein
MLLSLLNFLEKVLTDMNSEYGLQRESELYRLEYISTHNGKRAE